MEALYTTLGFFALTAVSIWLHLRKGGGGAGTPAPRAAPSRPCPRCKAAVPGGATFCPGCGVPQQIYEVVAAPAAAPSTGAEGRLHAVVRADMCVGCGTCVAACPEPGAITLAGKLAVVDQGLCMGHSECASACPVGAILLTTGAAVHRVEVPGDRAPISRPTSRGSTSSGNWAAAD